MNDTGPYLPRAATSHRSPRKLTVWLSGIAAALIVALLAGAFLMQGHGPSHGGPIVGSGSTPSIPSTCAANAINVTLPAHAYLADLAMTSATDGWAVGAVRDNNDDAPVRSLILHYSHCQWTQTGPAIPNMGLWSISMDSPTDGWISGGLDGTGNVLLHYTGGQWQQVHVAALDTVNGFFGTVRMQSAAEGWMILRHAKNTQGLGSSSLAHERNGVWSLLNAPLSNIVDVAPIGPDDAWIAGTVSDADKTGMLARYQAGRWVATASMGGLIDESHLRLRMLSPTDGWATAEFPTADGNYFEGVETALVLHYDGKAWKPANTGANPAAQRVSIFGDGEGWAFTLTHHADNADPGNLSVSLAQYESGGTWRTVKMPASNISDIAGLSRVSAGEYWAIGYTETIVPNPNDTARHTMMGVISSVLLHFANGTWTQYGR